MKIMLQNHTFYPILGGIENYLYHVSKVLQKMGHEPKILCEKHDHRLGDFEHYYGIEVIRHPYYNVPKSMLFSKPKIVANQLKNFVSKHVGNIDLIISRYPHYCFATCSLGLRAPVFYVPPSVHWRQLRKASLRCSLKVKFFNLVWKKSIDHLERESLLKSDRIIVLSKNMEDSLRDYYGLNGVEIHVIYPGVELGKFTRDRDPLLIEELHIGRKDVVLLYVGRLSPDKNVERVIKEFEAINRRDVKLIIVGYGSDRGRLERMAKGLGLEKDIIFAGPRNDVERFYSIADVFVSPSKHEPFGQVILEAMAAGLPCIAFRKVLPEYEVAAEEMIEDGVTGYCADPCDKNEFRQRLSFLIDHSDIRREMGEAGRKRCRGKFTWENHVSTLLDLMEIRSAEKGR